MPEVGKIQSQKYHRYPGLLFWNSREQRCNRPDAAARFNFHPLCIVLGHGSVRVPESHSEYIDHLYRRTWFKLDSAVQLSNSLLEGIDGTLLNIEYPLFLALSSHRSPAACDSIDPRDKLLGIQYIAIASRR